MQSKKASSRARLLAPVPLFRPLFLATGSGNIASLTQSVACLRASLAFSEREEPEVQGFNGGGDAELEAAAAAQREETLAERERSASERTRLASSQAEAVRQLGHDEDVDGSAARRHLVLERRGEIGSRGRVERGESESLKEY